MSKRGFLLGAVCGAVAGAFAVWYAKRLEDLKELGVDDFDDDDSYFDDLGDLEETEESDFAES